MKKTDKKSVRDMIIAICVMALFVMAGVFAGKSGHKEEIDKVLLWVETACESMIGILFIIGGVIITTSIIKIKSSCRFLCECIDESDKETFIKNGSTDDYFMKSGFDLSNEGTFVLAVCLSSALIIFGSVMALEKFCLVYGPVLEIPILKVTVVTICLFVFLFYMFKALSIIRMNTKRIVSSEELKNVKAKLVALKKDDKGRYRAYYEYFAEGRYHIHREVILHKESEKASMSPLSTYDLNYSEAGDVAITDKERELVKKCKIKCIIYALAAVLMILIKDPVIYYFSVF